MSHSVLDEFNDELEATITQWARDRVPMNVGGLVTAAIAGMQNPTCSSWRAEIAQELAKTKTQRDNAIRQMDQMQQNQVKATNEINKLTKRLFESEAQRNHAISYALQIQNEIDRLTKKLTSIHTLSAI